MKDASTQVQSASAMASPPGSARGESDAFCHVGSGFQAEGFKRAFELAFRTVRDLAPRFSAAHMQLAFVGLLRPPAVHFDVDLAGQFSAQVVHVDAGAAVDQRRILAGEQADSQRLLPNARQV